MLVKTHNATGLKYLCRHLTDTEATCYSYLGSGVYWKRHLSKHGFDITTEILECCDTEVDARIRGRFWSEKFNVVKDQAWANLVPEEGQGGADPVKYRKKHTGWRGFKMCGEDNPSKRPEVRLKISQRLKGRAKSSEHCKKISQTRKQRGIEPWNKGKSNPYATTDHMNIDVVCPYCGMVGGKGAMIRWHFDKCKDKPEQSNEIFGKNL